LRLAFAVYCWGYALKLEAGFRGVVHVEELEAGFRASVGDIYGEELGSGFLRRCWGYMFDETRVLLSEEV
jgi:hypothetical protein